MAAHWWPSSIDQHACPALSPGVAAPLPPVRGTLRRRPQHLGPAHVSSWDVLWTKSTYGLTAARRLPPTGGRAVSAIAGLNCLTMKKRLVQVSA